TLFAFAIMPGAIMDIAQPEMVVEAMQIIDMPLYVITLIGVWKILGVLALANRRFRLINEWAYAGFFFDLTGASFAHAAGGDTVTSIVVPLVFLIPLAGSYMLRPSTEEAPAYASALKPALAA
ncbi:MAG: DoxX family protein, partial [Proteobacteria bacterium]|nr:DoxX family protein [Pseudomonadota bacterium]